MKTTKKQYNIFVLECKKWIKYFGLYNNSYHFIHGDYDDSLDGAGLAYCIPCGEAHDRTFTICFTREIEEGYTTDDEQIKIAAFHEILESMLYRLYHLGMQRSVADEEMRNEVHNIIIIFENTVLRDLKGKSNA